MLDAILGLADKLSLTVIAEGIETSAQLRMLQHLGCPLGQGFLLARPVPADTMHTLLAAGGLLPITELAAEPLG
jgi:EAL domain-containing protein (putative c-di-GMP-specific phosphodiesterase class I)